MDNKTTITVKKMFISFYKQSARDSLPFIIRGNQKKIHTCKNTKIPISAKFTLQLVSQIGGLIVQKFHIPSVRQSILQIYILSQNIISKNACSEKQLAVADHHASKNPIYSSNRLNSIFPEQTGSSASPFPSGSCVYRSSAFVSTRHGITS